ncbi:MAG TPA: hypothetical protein VHU20_01860, partial [Candidatus Eisenbacteria bacterium]|nr:hypothetical protein [Candidatus Eisenbacteria bacterium]
LDDPRVGRDLIEFQGGDIFALQKPEMSLERSDAFSWSRTPAAASRAFRQFSGTAPLTWW